LRNGKIRMEIGGAVMGDEEGENRWRSSERGEARKD
jgi:hypothetical protein